MSEGTATITVLEWPRGMSPEERAGVLVEAIGLDVYMAEQRVKKSPPMVIGRQAVNAAKSVARVLSARGVKHVLVADQDIARMPAAMQAKRLVPALGAPEPMYFVEPWRGEGRGLKMADVFCMVRGRIGRTSTGPVEMEITLERNLVLPDMYGVLIETSQKRSASTSDVIDLWCADHENGRTLKNGSRVPGIWRVRINGDKFNWDVLGGSRGFSDNDNADKLALLLAEQATESSVEVGFGAFREASGAALGASLWMTSMGTVKTDQGPAFEFYSGWCGVQRYRERFLSG